MTEDLRISERPSLERPIMIAAFRGWNDGGQGASLAAGYLAKVWNAERFGDLDPEHFYDFQATRPHVSLVDGMTRRIDWPENAFYHCRIPGADRDAVLLLGIEPNLRWRTFGETIIRRAPDPDLPPVTPPRAQPARRARPLRAPRRAAGRRDRHVRARGGVDELRRAGERGGRLGRGDRRIRPGAGAAGRRARGGRAAPVGRHDRRRADAVPA